MADLVDRIAGIFLRIPTASSARLGAIDAGGHGMLWWRHRHELVRAGLDSFEGLISAGRGSAPG